ncbi:hypothetical protein T01_11263 [Trichinella spiralis]|uniref:Uncharacterized protein n=1 Tax=Trichinella spiralis TaxID=6334 RepID=A0A0V1ARC6_TRISP|nr:hypothetical protein T01_11263 [Trichinella spiralis]
MSGKTAALPLKHSTYKLQYVDGVLLFCWRVGIVGNAYIDLTKEERQYRWYGEQLERPLPYLENFMPPLLMRKATFIDNVSQKCSSEITDNLSFTIIFTVEVDDSTRYRYLLNKPVVFTNSFSQKNALINHYGQIGTLQRMRS